MMKDVRKNSFLVQKLVLGMINVSRNHNIPDKGRKENVVEHSYSLAMLCWQIYSALGLKLSLAKILKYALVHDLVERGQREDTNTYAKAHERVNKDKREKL